MAHILVIDDESQICLMLRSWLESEGHSVLDARNGNEGLKSFIENSPDLVITDLVMPEKEGLETISELKKSNPQVKIVAISGGGRNQPEIYLNMAKKLGAVKIFKKPIRKENFLNAVNQLVN